MLQNLCFLTPQKDHCGKSLNLDTLSLFALKLLVFLEIGKPGRRKATLEPQMQREEHSGYFKYGVLPISISVWFPLPKMRIPLLLVLFHKTLLAGTGKQ